MLDAFSPSLSSFLLELFMPAVILSEYKDAKGIQDQNNQPKMIFHVERETGQ